MRLFGSDRISKLMDRMGLGEGEVIQHSMISKSIERAQKKVEENNFGIRKRLLEYDDVMNSQREVVYTKRRHGLFGERVTVDIANMMYDLCESIVKDCHGFVEFEEFNFQLIRYLSIESPVTAEEFKSISPDDLIEMLNKEALKSHKRKIETIAKQAFPVIRNVYEKQAHSYENIVVPITDGTKVFQVVTNLKKAYESEGRELVSAYEKSVILATIDESWKEHLREMDDLKQSVQNASYEQKDPLLIYKLESFDLFKGMIDKNNKEVSSFLMKGHIPISTPDEVREAQARRKLDRTRYQESKTDVPSYKDSTSDTGAPNKPPVRQSIQPVRTEAKVGRNAPCPCGSGKKYKNCHANA